MADGTMPVAESGPVGGAPAPVTEAAPSGSDAVRDYMGGDFSAIDPFLAPPPGGETAADAAPVQGAPGTGQQPVAAPGTGPQPAPVADPREVLLARMTELQAQQAAIQQEMVRAQAGQGAAPAAPPPDPLASFSVPLGTIPDQLLAGITAEDPTARRAAVTSLSQGLANQSAIAAIRQVQQMLHPVLNQVLPAAIRNVALQVYQEQASGVQGADAFYSANPDLNHPDLKPVVEMVFQRMIPQMRQGWTPEAQQMVAEETRRVLRTFAGSPTMPAPVGYGAPPVAAPGMVGGAGVSPPRPSPGTHLTDEALMLQTLRRHGMA